MFAKTEGEYSSRGVEPIMGPIMIRSHARRLFFEGVFRLLHCDFCLSGNQTRDTDKKLVTARTGYYNVGILYFITSPDGLADNR